MARLTHLFSVLAIACVLAGAWLAVDRAWSKSRRNMQTVDLKPADIQQEVLSVFRLNGCEFPAIRDRGTSETPPDTLRLDDGGVTAWLDACSTDKRFGFVVRDHKADTNRPAWNGMPVTEDDNLSDDEALRLEFAKLSDTRHILVIDEREYSWSRFQWNRQEDVEPSQSQVTTDIFRERVRRQAQAFVDYLLAKKLLVPDEAVRLKALKEKAAAETDEQAETPPVPTNTTKD